MSKRLLIVAGVLVLLLTACGSGKDESSKPSTPADQGKATTVATAAATKAAPTKEATSGEGLKDAFEPLSLLTGQMFGSEVAGSEQVAQEADPDLAALLLTESDLPSGYSNPIGDIGYSIDSPDGQMKMAARMFMEGGFAADEMGPIVMSVAMTMPASALADFDSELDQLDEMTDQDLQDAMGGAAMMGIEFKDISIEKVSDLGDGGASLHMVMDMSGLMEGLGDLGGEGMGAFESGIAFDAYVFRSGDDVLMLVTMWPAGEASPVDAQALAEAMDARAQ